MRTIQFAMATIFIGLITGAAYAGSIATGLASSDSISFGDGSVWVPYQNGADTAGLSESGTVVRYNPTGAVLHTWTTDGNVDGLKVDPSTGLVWALQNNDGHSALTAIDPVTNGGSFASVANRGFDDVVSSSGQGFLNETNPVLLPLTSGLTFPVVVASILTAGRITDPDSTKPMSSGEFDLTGEADQPVVFVENRSSTVLPLQNATGDTVYSTDTAGSFLLADMGATAGYMLTAVGLITLAFGRYRRKARQREQNYR